MGVQFTSGHRARLSRLECMHAVLRVELRPVNADHLMANIMTQASLLHPSPPKSTRQQEYIDCGQYRLTSECILVSRHLGWYNSPISGAFLVRPREHTPTAELEKLHSWPQRTTKNRSDITATSPPSIGEVETEASGTGSPREPLPI